MSSTTPLDKVPAHILALSLKIQEAITYDDDGAGVLPETFFAEHVLADAEITPEQFVKGQVAEMDFADAVLLGHGNKSKSHLQANANLERTTVIAKAGNDEIRASYDRKIMVRAPGATEEKPKYGVGNLKLVSDIGRKVGNFKRIQDHLNLDGTSVFGQ
jgi:hypothetical protein